MNCLILFLYITHRGKESDCAQEVLDAVGERVSSAPNRRARIEALATVIDVPFFSSYKVNTLFDQKKHPTISDAALNPFCHQISYSSISIIRKRRSRSRQEIYQSTV